MARGTAHPGRYKKVPEPVWLRDFANRKSALAELQGFLVLALPNIRLFLRFPPVFGLILRFFCTPDSNFHTRAQCTKHRFCSLYVSCVSLPRVTQDNNRKRNLVVVRGFTSKSNSHMGDSIMEKYIFDQCNVLLYGLKGDYSYHA